MPTFPVEDIVEIMLRGEIIISIFRDPYAMFGVTLQAGREFNSTPVDNSLL